MKVSLFIIILLAGLKSFAIGDFDYKEFFRNDSALIYSRDQTANDWVLSSLQTFSYNDNGKLNSVIEKSLVSGSFTNKSEYQYDESDNLILQVNYVWNGSWLPGSKYESLYDDNDRLTEQIIEVNKSGVWENNRWQKNYKYDDEGRLLEYQMFYWRNGDWTLPTTDYSSYDDQGRLVNRTAVYPNGKVDYKVTYNYGTDGLRTETYAQYPLGDEWGNWWLMDYQYNDCGYQISQVRYTGSIFDWIPQTKTVIYSSFIPDDFPGKKVAICHNGHTIYVSKNAVKAHLAHGDCIGECTVEKKSERERERKEAEYKKPPFTVYPNPANERITVKFDSDECDDTKIVELTDFYGKKIRTYKIDGNSDLTIPRGNLLDGKYYLSVKGEETYSVIVIFK